jgi:hypothetical protein
MSQVAVTIVQSFLENAYDQIGKEAKYNFMNKYGPKKCPTEQIKREKLDHIYSWLHYAP